MGQSGIQTRFWEKVIREMEGTDLMAVTELGENSQSDLDQAEAASWSVRLGKAPPLSPGSQGEVLLGAEMGGTA